MSSEVKEIERLKKSIENQTGWGPVSNWHSKMFEELSEAIFKKTQVVLSVATLKRFFGVVKHDGSPSITTLDALARFLGESTWTAFKTKKKTPSWKIQAPGQPFYVSIGFILAMFTIGLLSNRGPELIINASEFEFSSKVLSREFPNSVVFDFSIPENLQAENFQIQQYWDPSKTIEIDPTQSQATGIYYHPGYFEAKLLIDGQIAKRHNLFLKSEGWLGQVEYENTPKYFDPILSKGTMKAPEPIAKEIAALEEATVTSFHFIDDLGKVSADNFKLQATIVNSFDDRWAVCHAIKIYFLGTSGAFIIPFSKLGCSSDDNLMLNDVYLNGKSNDLSALSADFTEPISLEIKVENQVVNISIAGEKVYSMAYSESMGNLVGMRFKFIGLGEILKYQLADQNGDVIPL